PCAPRPRGGAPRPPPPPRTPPAGRSRRLDASPSAPTAAKRGHFTHEAEASAKTIVNGGQRSAAPMSTPSPSHAESCSMSARTRGQDSARGEAYRLSGMAEQLNPTLKAVSDAVLAVAAELSVEDVLQRLVDSARDLAD